MNNLASSDYYNAPVNYLFNVNIFEFDIAKANISILYDADVLAPQDYERLFYADRMTRQYEIGMMQRNNPEITETLQKGLAIARESFFHLTKMDKEQVLHVNKDAIFVVKPMSASMPDKIDVDNHTTFTRRGTYQTYMKLGPAVDTYFTIGDFKSKEVTMKVRGISDEMMVKHEEDGFPEWIREIVRDQNFKGTRTAYLTANQYYSALTHLQTTCDGKVAHASRRFDAQGMFDIIDGISSFSRFQIMDLGHAVYSYGNIDSSYNASIIAMISNYLLEEIMRNGGIR